MTEEWPPQDRLAGPEAAACCLRKTVLEEEEEEEEEGLFKADAAGSLDPPLWSFYFATNTAPSISLSISSEPW